MEQKILILGAKGMLGQALAEVFLKQKPILWDIFDLDITDQEEIKKKIGQLKLTLILNAAAYTDVDCCETKIDLAMKVNGEAVGYLAQVAQDLKSTIVSYSTDYVFSGEKKEGYREDDAPHPLSIYGQSKLLGEKLLQENCNNYYLIRSSWMFGEFGERNFVKRILTKAAKEGSLKVVNDHFGKPTYAKDLAKRTKEIIEENKPFGIYHITNETAAGGISWYDFAKYAVELEGLKARVVPCHSTSFPQPAKRPQYAALINTKLEPMRAWEEALIEYLKQKSPS